MHKENTGAVILNGDCSAMPYKTVIVFGVARGGTSMVAGTLSKLGVFMGENLTALYEDNALGRCVNQNDKTSAKAIVKERNFKYAIWGFKKPSTRLWAWLSIFREPVYIVVFRDIFATANRRVISLDKALFAEMLKIIGQNLLLLVFLRFSKRPVLIASYEKVLLFPEDFVDTLYTFLGIADKSTRNEAIEFINPSPQAYLKKASTSSQLNAAAQWFGYIDAIETHKIIGWALSIADSAPARIELSINGVSTQTTIANLLRSDVAEVDTRFHAQCGFEFELSESNTLKTGDKIDIKIADLGINLINSPTIVR